MTGSLPAREAKEVNETGRAPKPASGSSGSHAIPASSGVAKKFWIDPSIAAWPPGADTEGPHRIPYFPAYAEAGRPPSVSASPAFIA